MKQEIRALMLNLHEFPELALQDALRNHSIQTDTAQTCQEAAWRLASSEPPHLVFTATELPDGQWVDVIELAAEAEQPVNVIVVSPVADVPLYIAVMERRAFDFITHSFDAEELSYILRSATENVLSRRVERGHWPGRAPGGTCPQPVPVKIGAGLEDPSSRRIAPAFLPGGTFQEAVQAPSLHERRRDNESLKGVFIHF